MDRKHFILFSMARRLVGYASWDNMTRKYYMLYYNYGKRAQKKKKIINSINESAAQISSLTSE